MYRFKDGDPANEIEVACDGCDKLAPRVDDVGSVPAGWFTLMEEPATSELFDATLTQHYCTPACLRNAISALTEREHIEAATEPCVCCNGYSDGLGVCGKHAYCYVCLARGHDDECLSCPKEKNARDTRELSRLSAPALARDWEARDE